MNAAYHHSSLILLPHLSDPCEWGNANSIENLQTRICIIPPELRSKQTWNVSIHEYLCFGLSLSWDKEEAELEQFLSRLLLFMEA